MKTFDELFASAGVTPVVVRPRQRTPYELAVEERALDSVRVKTVRELIQERADEWSPKVHHVQDLDPLRDLVDDEDGRDDGFQPSSGRLAYERIDPRDQTLYDGVPSEVLTETDHRPSRSDARVSRGVGERRRIVAQALKSHRSREEGAVLTMPQ